MVTVSPGWASPPVVPVITTSEEDSERLTVSSAVMSGSMVMVGADEPALTAYPSLSPAVPELPASSTLRTVASTVRSLSARRSSPLTSTLKVRSEATRPV